MICQISGIIFSFFHMHSESYNLAIALTQYSRSLPKPLQSSSSSNIFRLGHLERTSREDLEHCKKYEIVGVKELKSYKQRQKTMVRNKRQTLSLDNRPSTKASISSVSLSGTKLYYEKNEVLKTLPVTSTKPTRAQMKKLAVTRKDTIAKQLGETKKLIRHEFSLADVKAKLDRHKKNWDSYLGKERKGNMFPSLNQSIDMHRVKVEANRGKDQDENLANYRSYLWNQSLRTQDSENVFYGSKGQVKTLAEGQGLSMRGYSKLDSQKSWIDKKDQQGYRFQFIREKEDSKGSIR